jgi:hypothetical protein
MHKDLEVRVVAVYVGGPKESWELAKSRAESISTIICCPNCDPTSPKYFSDLLIESTRICRANIRYAAHDGPQCDG